MLSYFSRHQAYMYLRYDFHIMKSVDRGESVEFLEVVVCHCQTQLSTEYIDRRIACMYYSINLAVGHFIDNKVLIQDWPHR